MRLVLGILMLLALAAPERAAAKSCADYANQAAAQRGADTNDGDGDGVFCEALPCPCEGKSGKTVPAPAVQVIEARVTSVTDGDTIRVRAFGAKRSHYRVRLIGIDTPETDKPGTPVECGAKRATRYMEKLAGRRRLTLTTDPTQDTFDRYGRLLAYATTRAGHSLQIDMLDAGWAKTYVYQGRPFAQFDAFKAAENRARTAKKGVWGRCGADFHTPA
jgi:micrococcal nuclease